MPHSAHLSFERSSRQPHEQNTIARQEREEVKKREVRRRVDEGGRERNVVEVELA